MPVAKRASDYFQTEEGMAIKEALLDMVASEKFRTDASYSANIGTYSDSLMPFVDKHVQYITSHPSINPQQYIANLQLMTRIR